MMVILISHLFTMRIINVPLQSTRRPFLHFDSSVESEKPCCTAVQSKDFEHVRSSSKKLFEFGQHSNHAALDELWKKPQFGIEQHIWKRCPHQRRDLAEPFTWVAIFNNTYQTVMNQSQQQKSRTATITPSNPEQQLQFSVLDMMTGGILVVLL